MRWHYEQTETPGAYRALNRPARAYRLSIGASLVEWKRVVYRVNDRVR
jgi:hypothetical protein